MRKTAKKLDVVDTLIKAAKESKGETIDIVFEHELPGITEEMYEWWGQNETVWGDRSQFIFWLQGMRITGQASFSL